MRPIKFSGNRSLSPNQKAKPSGNKKKKNNKNSVLWILAFWWTTVKIKESEKLNLARKLKRLWNIRVKVIPIVVGALETVLWSLKRLEELEITFFLIIETIQITALLRLALVTQKSL